MAQNGYGTFMYALHGFLQNAQQNEAKTAMEWICHFLCLVLLNELCIIIILFGLNLKLQFCAKASFSLLLILLAYHGEEEGGVFARYVPGHGPVHREHIGHVEPDTGRKLLAAYIMKIGSLNRLKSIILRKMEAFSALRPQQETSDSASGIRAREASLQSIIDRLYLSGSFLQSCERKY